MSHAKTHLRVVAALLVRETTTRFGSKPGGYVWALLDPSAHIFLLVSIFQAIAHTPALGTSFALFFATGYIAFQFYQAMSAYLNSAVRANRTLLSYPGVAPIDTIVARCILQAGTTALVATIVLGSILAIARLHFSISWPPIFHAILNASLLGVGIGMMNNVLFAKFPAYEQIFNIVNRPLFLVSGVFFLVDSIPHPYQYVVLLNPLAHIIMIFRTGFYPEYRAIGADLEYLYLLSFLTFFVGMLIFTSYSTILRKE